MKRLYTLLVVLVMAFSFVTVQAFAANTGKQGEASKKNDQGKMSKDNMKYGAEYTGTFLKGSDLLGKDVRNAKGEKLGSVENLAVNKDGQIAYVIVSRGELLGMGGESIPIPWNMVSFRIPAEGQKAEGAKYEMKSANAVLVVNLSKKDLEKAPTLKSDDWNRLSDSKFDQKVHGYYGKNHGTTMKHEQMQGTEHHPAKKDGESKGKAE